MQSLVQPLFSGPIDVIGDVHGELAALRDLLARLGYDESGRHAEGRRLAFLGDLTDRGPDSPGVVTLVQSLVDAGRAQCVLGNHDLNILLGDRKYDNPWYFGEEFHAEDGFVPPQAPADDRIREQVQGFFRTLPLVLEREDVRVVHACWLPAMIEAARSAASVETLYWEHRRRIEDFLRGSPPSDECDRELHHQNGNPVKVLTSGTEMRAAQPYLRAGKWRHVERVSWWNDYRDAQICVFGHYAESGRQQYQYGAAYCLDFAVGYRWAERRNGQTPFRTRLAALRLPEAKLFLDGDGT